MTKIGQVALGSRIVLDQDLVLPTLAGELNFIIFRQ